MTTLCTFNINNLFLRYKFGTTFPGDMSRKSESEDFRWGYLPLYKPGLFKTFNPDQRVLETKVLHLPDGKLPDILCLQEVESLQALRAFNEVNLDGHYTYSALLDSRDLRQIDVGILSTLPISYLKSNVDLPDPADKGFPWLFSRDCLEVSIELNKSGSRVLTIFVNHFKSKMTQGNTAEEKQAAAQKAAKKRQRQADTVLKLVKERFNGSDYKNRLFAVVGDLNDEPGSAPLQDLLGKSNLENVLDRLAPEDRWTHYYKSKGQVSQFDYLLLSPALTRAVKNRPFVNRVGLGFRDLSKKDGGILPKQAVLHTREDAKNSTKVKFDFKRLDGVSPSLAASDHCPVAIEF
jgi:endonuclease/exonuclease/phosphatase family metal-dependent hydrolase